MTSVQKAQELNFRAAANPPQKSRLLHKQRIFLGRRNPLRPAHAMEPQSALSLLGRPSGPRNSRAGKGLHENCRHVVGGHFSSS